MGVNFMVVRCVATLDTTSFGHVKFPTQTTNKTCLHLEGVFDICSYFFPEIVTVYNGSSQVMIQLDALSLVNVVCLLYDNITTPKF